MIELDKRNLSPFAECGGITDRMVNFIQSVHLKSQVLNPELVSEVKEYAADEFIRVTSTDMSAGQAARLIASCRGDKLQHGFGKRCVTFIINVDSQDLRDVCVQSSLNLTGPHGEARQEK